MLNLNLLVAILSGLKTILGDPALGYRGKAVLSIVELLATAIKHGSVANEKLEELKVQVEQMVAAGREPTKSEWAELRARSDLAIATLEPLEPDTPE